jgi:hypothetical protein
MSPFSYVGQVGDSWRRLVISESVISFGEELEFRRAPIPKPRLRIAVMVKPGALRSWRAE